MAMTGARCPVRIGASSRKSRRNAGFGGISRLGMIREGRGGGIFCPRGVVWLERVRKGECLENCSVHFGSVIRRQMCIFWK